MHNQNGWAKGHESMDCDSSTTTTTDMCEQPVCMLNVKKKDAMNCNGSEC